jgi:hypothetical protein
VLVTKPSICGFGMNWQHCADTGFVGLNDSFEQVYQAIRRFWRFGQTQARQRAFHRRRDRGRRRRQPSRKEADAERMAAAMVRTWPICRRRRPRRVRDRPDYNPTQPVVCRFWRSPHEAASKTSRPSIRS